MESIRVRSRSAGIALATLFVFAAGTAKADVRDERGNVIYEGVYPGGVPQIEYGPGGKIVSVTVQLDNGRTAVITDGYHPDLKEFGRILRYAARHGMKVTLVISPIGNLVGVILHPRETPSSPSDPQPAPPIPVQ